ncbi:hypothetical protein H8D36_07095 [archaeon]|nr:hypothetical protein [archaeon]
MNHLTIENNKCIIKLNKKFYPESIIDKAVKAFMKDYDISADKDKIIIKKKENENLEIVGYQFCDYLLSLIQEEGLI